MSSDDDLEYMGELCGLGRGPYSDEQKAVLGGLIEKAKEKWPDWSIPQVEVDEPDEAVVVHGGEA